jgi:hypothetical protein
MDLADDGPPDQIVSWFRAQGWALTLHMEAPPRGDVSNVPRALRVLPRFSHWVDLVPIQPGGVVARWYSGGMDEAQAVRGAARRWRTEHQDSE